MYLGQKFVTLRLKSFKLIFNQLEDFMLKYSIGKSGNVMKDIKHNSSTIILTWSILKLKRWSYIHFYWYFDRTIKRNSCCSILYNLKVMVFTVPVVFFLTEISSVWLQVYGNAFYLSSTSFCSSPMYNCLLQILVVSFIVMLSCLQCVMNILLKKWTFVWKQISIPVFMYLENLCIKCTGWPRQ